MTIHHSIASQVGLGKHVFQKQEASYVKRLLIKLFIYQTAYLYL